MKRTTKKKSNSEFIAELNQKQDNQYLCLNEYINSKTKLTFKCKECGLEFESTPHTMLSHRVGKECKHHSKKTLKAVKKLIFQETNGTLELIGKYNGCHDKTKFQCTVCGYKWDTQPDLVYRGLSHCPLCSETAHHDTEWFKQKVAELVGDEYSVIEDYITSKTPIMLKHNKCGNKFKMAPKNFYLIGQRCPKCQRAKVAKKEQLPFEAVQERLDKVTDGQYKLVSKKAYNGISSKTEIEHLLCGTIWQCAPDSICRGFSGCPFFNQSKGEVLVEHYLTEKGYEFRKQFRFSQCKDKRPLPFDFVILNKQKPIIALEFQGRQHYEPVFGTYEFDKIKAHDAIKRNFCQTNKIKLVEINNSANVSGHKKLYSLIKNTLDNQLHVNPVPSL